MSFRRSPAWWWTLCGVATLLLIRLAVSGSLATHQHPHTFFSAAQMLWDGQDPYEVDFGFGRDYWFYSPFCGLFIYGWGVVLPRPLAAWVLAALSTAAFLVVIREITLAAWRGWITAAILVSFLTAAIAWHKLELLIVAGELASLIALTRGRPRLGGIFLGLVTGWKGISLSILGLAVLALRRSPDLRPFLASVGIVLFASILLPACVLGWDANFAMHIHWWRSLGISVEQRASMMENIYRSIAFLFGGSGGYPILGILAAGVLALSSWFKPGDLRYAFAAGAWFRVVFGPLHQNNAAILTTPLVLWEGNLVWLSGAALVLGFGYLAPLGWLREISLKSIFLFFWGLVRLRLVGKSLN